MNMEDTKGFAFGLFVGGCIAFVLTCVMLSGQSKQNHELVRLLIEKYDEIADKNNKLLAQRNNIMNKYKKLVVDLVKVPEAKETLRKHIRFEVKNEHKVSPQGGEESNISQ